jgi:ribosomal protein S18 acetylase RimI-like enzyme
VTGSQPAIRVARAADAAALAEFGERTFRAAFEADNRREDIDAYVTATYTPGRVRADLADPARITLVVESGGVLAAFAQLREGAAPACVGGAAPIELLRFYVDPAWQGRGVAQSLMDAVVAAATTRGAKTVWLGVWERNPRAIAFYAKSGFRDAGSQPFVLGTDRQTDRIMVRAI